MKPKTKNVQGVEAGCCNYTVAVSGVDGGGGGGGGGGGSYHRRDRRPRPRRATMRHPETREAAAAGANQ